MFLQILNFPVFFNLPFSLIDHFRMPKMRFAFSIFLSANSTGNQEIIDDGSKMAAARKS